MKLRDNLEYAAIQAPEKIGEFIYGLTQRVNFERSAIVTSLMAGTLLFAHPQQTGAQAISDMEVLNNKKCAALNDGYDYAGIYIDPTRIDEVAVNTELIGQALILQTGKDLNGATLVNSDSCIEIESIGLEPDSLPTYINPETNGTGFPSSSNGNINFELSALTKANEVTRQQCELDFNGNTLMCSEPKIISQENYLPYEWIPYYLATALSLDGVVQVVRPGNLPVTPTPTPPVERFNVFLPLTIN